MKAALAGLVAITTAPPQRMWQRDLWCSRMVFPLVVVLGRSRAATGHRAKGVPGAALEWPPPQWLVVERSMGGWLGLPRGLRCVRWHGPVWRAEGFWWVEVAIRAEGWESVV